MQLSQKGDSKTQTRSHATRKALLDATIASLSELGYSRTSTTEIVRRAGVSRGAQVHHFPTKAELVAAAITHLFHEQASDVASRLELMTEEEFDALNGIDLLWDALDSATYRAALALAAAAITDNELKPVVTKLLKEFDETLVTNFRKYFKFNGEFESFWPIGLRFAFSTLSSAALYRELGMEDRAQEIVAVLKAMASVTNGQMNTTGVQFEISQ